MKPRRIALTPFVVIGAISLATLIPLLDSRLPASTDAEYHLHRIVELDWLLRQGIWWPRFAPDLAYGYGYPLFNYYGPLAYYLGVGLHWLGLDFAPALLTLMCASILWGAVGMYTLSASLWGRTAGYVSTMLYAFAPYLFINALYRCTVAEILGLAWLPWLLWCLQQAMRHPSPWRLAGLGLVYAALLFTHNVSAFFGTGLLALWWLTQASALWLWAPADQPKWRALTLPTLALACGLLSAAYFFLPALLETSAVQLQRITALAVFDYHINFIQPADLLAMPRPFDPRLAHLPMHLNTLGWPAGGLALAGALAVRRYQDATQRLFVVMLTITLLALIALMTSISLPLWENISLLQLFQFPWRLLGPAGLVAALLAGAAFGDAVLTSGPRWLRALPPVLLAASALYAFSWSYIHYFPPIVHPDLNTIHEAEVRGGSIGTTATGEYLPVGVRTMPPAERLAPLYAQTPLIERLAPESLPASVTVLATQNAVLSAQATLSATHPYTATFLWFNFPGWNAQVDGQPVPIHTSKPYGFISVPAPAGQHTLRINFSDTPLRQGAGWLSLVGLFGLAGLTLYSTRTALARTEPATRPPAPTRLLLALTLTGLALGGLRAYWHERDNPFRYSPFDGQHVAGVAHPFDINFGDQLNLIGADFPTTLPADQPIPVMLYWRPYGVPATDYSIAVHLEDAQAHLFGQHDAQHPADYPTSKWSATNYSSDPHPLTPYPGTPPGTYRLIVSVYPEEGDHTPLDIYDANHQPASNRFEVGQITLTPALNLVAEASLHPTHPLQAPLGPLTLLGFDLDDTTFTSGDELPLGLYWRATAPDAQTTRVRLSLRAADGMTLSIGEFPPVGADLTAWPIGQSLRAIHTAIVAPALPAGPADLRLQVLDAHGQALAPELTLISVTITVPTRTFNLPETQVPLDVRVGPDIRLLGFDLPVTTLEAGKPVTLTLYWQTTALLTVRYVVFVHLLDAQGHIVTQRDVMPRDGTRPTTGWLPFEIIQDVYHLDLPADLPPGTYTLAVGLYDELTLQALETTDASGATFGPRYTLATPLTR